VGNQTKRDMIHQFILSWGHKLSTVDVFTKLPYR